jgi:hypothetical protein
MNDFITVEVCGGCPKCGNPDIFVPEDFTDETPTKCTKCGYAAKHAIFFRLIPDRNQSASEPKNWLCQDAIARD